MRRDPGEGDLLEDELEEEDEDEFDEDLDDDELDDEDDDEEEEENRMKLGWKTLTGAITVAAGILAQPDVLALLGPKAAGILTAIGTVLTAVGLRHAIAKQQQG